MDRYSLIVVSDGTSPIRRLDVAKRSVRRAAIGAGVAAVVLLGLLVDYVRVRIDHSELGHLRSLAQEQQARIDGFEASVGALQDKLSRVAEFERKVRVIANLPGSVAAGGADVAEVGPEESASDGVGPVEDGRGGPEESGPSTVDAPDVGAAAGAAAVPAPRGPRQGDRVGALRREAERLGLVAEARALSLKELVDELEDKHHRLASSPAIWPARGWLTSGFGQRISPFTGRRQFHAGIDIASAPGAAVVAPADGRVEFVGAKGPLGNTVLIDHGYGIRTQYGHNQKILVKRGDVVERGQKIALVGSTGRSTGPHLHYTVEVNGKAVNPIDYIFD
jgi:murein DD-endopeptidase MepM/ murein hydrolase activator NlpD